MLKSLWMEKGRLEDTDITMAEQELDRVLLDLG
jgi:hypothetical protein